MIPMGLQSKFNVGDKVVVLETGRVYKIGRITVNIWTHDYAVAYGLEVYNAGFMDYPEKQIGTPQEWYEYTITKICKESTEAAEKLLILMEAVK